MKSSDIAPIVLAAGNSTRMGFPKALLPLGEDTFLTRILGTLEHLELQGTTLVLGREAAQIEARIRDRQVRIVINPNPDEGLASSVKAALSSIDPSSVACLLWPVDQPAISEYLARALIDTFISSKALLALPCCGERRGHPVIFHRRLFPEIMDTPLNEGLKRVVLRHQREMVLLPTNEVAVIEDVDTPEDYFRLTGKKLSGALLRISNPATG